MFYKMILAGFVNETQCSLMCCNAEAYVFTELLTTRLLASAGVAAAHAVITSLSYSVY